MEFKTAAAPHFAPDNKVSLVMLQVLLALVPAILCYVWFFGIGILVNIIIASATAVAFEALMLKLRARPLEPFLKDYSAIVTAWLLAIARKSRSSLARGPQSTPAATAPVRIR